jgi:hypothetical protein
MIEEAGPARHRQREARRGRRTGKHERLGAVVAISACLLLLAQVASGGGESPQAQQGPVTAESILAQEPPELVERLFEEKMLLVEVSEKEGEGTLFVAYVLFEKPRSRVVHLLIQPERQREYRPELRHIEVVERGPDTRVDEHRIKIMFTNVVYRLRVRRDRATERLSWHLDPSFDNDLRRMQGFWELYELGEDRTLGRFGSTVDVGRAVPRMLQDALSRKTVLRTVKNTRKWVDSDGRWRP